MRRVIAEKKFMLLCSSHRRNKTPVKEEERYLLEKGFPDILASDVNKTNILFFNFST